MIYLDNCATTQVDEAVITVMNNYHRNLYGNPSSLHRMGMIAEKIIDKTRSQIGTFLNVEAKCIHFLSGGTEGNNFAIVSAIDKNKRQGKKIITTKIEHPSVLEVFKYYEANGYEVSYIDVNQYGIIDMEQLEREMTPDTILLSVMKVNNEVGTIQNIQRIAEVAKTRSPKCIIHSDCVQAFGKVPLNPIQEGIDILTFSGHKLHGPKGIGGVYIAKELSLKPTILGGGQEKGIRSGTENVPGIVGLGMATQLVTDTFQSDTKDVKELKGKMIELLCKEIEGIHFNCMNTADFSPHILSIAIEGVKSEILLHLLEKKDIFVSSGSACSSNKKSQSHVLKSMNLSAELIDGTLRISFSKYNTLEEIEFTVQVLKESIDNLRKIIRR